MLAVHSAPLQFLLRNPTLFVSETSPPSGDRRAIDIFKKKTTDWLSSSLSVAQIGNLKSKSFFF